MIFSITLIHKSLKSPTSILSWIERIYKPLRGFELGAFNPAILLLLFKQQTVHWEHLVMGYIDDIILYIHGFCDRLLANLCMEEQVRDNLWAVLVEEILLIYKKIIEHVTFTLITTNHYFSENPEKAHTARSKEAWRVANHTNLRIRPSN